MNQGGLRLKNTKKKNSLFSLVTVVKDNEKFLEETIKSVLNQSFKDFEYIIIDGNSDDNTLNIIKFCPCIQRLYKVYVDGKDVL